MGVEFVKFQPVQKHFCEIIPLCPEVQPLADELTAAGYLFEMEYLTGGKVNVACHHLDAHPVALASSLCLDDEADIERAVVDVVTRGHARMIRFLDVGKAQGGGAE